MFIANQNHVDIAIKHLRLEKQKKLIKISTKQRHQTDITNNITIKNITHNITNNT